MGSSPKKRGQEPVEKLTQNAAFHTDMVQQLGPWPLPHRLGQGLREHVLANVFSSHTQGLAQPGEEGAEGRGAQGLRTAPQLPGMPPTCR